MTNIFFKFIACQPSLRKFFCSLSFNCNAFKFYIPYIVPWEIFLYLYQRYSLLKIKFCDIFRSLIHLELSLEYGVKWRLNFISRTIFVERSNFLHLYHISSLHTSLGVHSWLLILFCLSIFCVCDETCVLITMILYCFDMRYNKNLKFVLSF